MIIPYNVLFRRNLSLKGRDDASDGSSNEGNLSPQNQAIIGAVVGGVALIARILTFLIKKQKWDRIRQREEALLALHAPPPYTSNSQSRCGSRSLWTRSTPPRKSISPRPLVAARPVTLPPPVTREVEEQEQPPPAYGAPSTAFPIPIYDPSRYPFQHQYQQFRPTSALTVNSGCLHYVAGDIVHGQRSSLPGSRLSLPFGLGAGQRDIMQGRAPDHERRQERRQGQTQAQARAQAQNQVLLRGSRGLSQSTDPGSSANMNAPWVTPENAGSRPPRKPKPVLSRIITNFG